MPYQQQKELLFQRLLPDLFAPEIRKKILICYNCGIAVNGSLTCPDCGRLLK